MILGVVFLFYPARAHAVVMALTVGIGVAWTFGLAYLFIGNLNSSTGFLVSIVVGNGINFGIIYMARYLEARRTVGASSRASGWRTARPGSPRSPPPAPRWSPTARSSSPTSAASSTSASSAASGMLLCWVATYLFLPAMLVLSERLVPVRPERGRRRRAAGRLRAAVRVSRRALPARRRRVRRRRGRDRLPGLRGPVPQRRPDGIRQPASCAPTRPGRRSTWR